MTLVEARCMVGCRWPNWVKNKQAIMVTAVLLLIKSVGHKFFYTIKMGQITGWEPLENCNRLYRVYVKSVELKQTDSYIVLFYSPWVFKALNTTHQFIILISSHRGLGSIYWIPTGCWVVASWSKTKNLLTLVACRLLWKMPSLWEKKSPSGGETDKSGPQNGNLNVLHFLSFSFSQLPLLNE